MTTAAVSRPCTAPEAPPPEEAFRIDLRETLTGGYCALVTWPGWKYPCHACIDADPARAVAEARDWIREREAVVGLWGARP